MGWSNGKFIHTNGVFSGNNVWEQDQLTGEKITTVNHDASDNDLADGINSSLNVDGRNKMKAAIDVGGFGINNVLKATVSTQSPNFGQVIDAFNLDGSNILHGTTPDGTNISVDLSQLATNIGAGTVTSVAAGSGLVTDTGSPITGAGTISLSDSGVSAGAYTGASITVDQFGRITAASSNSGVDMTIGNFSSQINLAAGGTPVSLFLAGQNGAGAGLVTAAERSAIGAGGGGGTYTADEVTLTVNANQFAIKNIDLATVQNGTGKVTIKYTGTGTDAVILAATQTIAGVMKAGDKARLDNIFDTVQTTQAAYDALTPDPSTVYYIIG